MTLVKLNSLFANLTDAQSIYGKSVTGMCDG
jgi:hypothetical protein